jgi:hypothetical protein
MLAVKLHRTSIQVFDLEHCSHATKSFMEDLFFYVSKANDGSLFVLKSLEIDTLDEETCDSQSNSS